MNTDIANVLGPCSWLPAFAGTTEAEYAIEELPPK